MKITLVREEKESGRETVSTCEADVLLERIKTETKAAHVTALRTMLLYTTPDARGHYEHIDKLPRIYPAVEYGRSRDGGRKLKRYNGIVVLEVNGLAGLSEVELVKEQARLLPQTWAAITGSSGRSVSVPSHSIDRAMVFSSRETKISAVMTSSAASSCPPVVVF